MVKGLDVVHASFKGSKICIKLYFLCIGWATAACDTVASPCVPYL